MSPLAIKALNDAWRELMPVPHVPEREKKQTRPVSSRVPNIDLAYVPMQVLPTMLDARM